MKGSEKKKHKQQKKNHFSVSVSLSFSLSLSVRQEILRRYLLILKTEKNTMFDLCL